MNDHVVESTSELSAFMKAGVMAGSERDAGFCSGGDEDDMSGLHSPSASEDSVEVQVTPISLRNKRKLAEPRKIQEPSTAPLKKRRFEQIEETITPDGVSRAIRSPSPFRPWSTCSKNNESKRPPSPLSPSPTTEPATASHSLACATTSPGLVHEEWSKREEDDARRRREDRIQEGFPPRLRELEHSSESSQIHFPPSHEKRRDSRQKYEALALTSGSESASAETSASTSTSSSIALLPLTHPRLQEEPLSLVLRGEIPRVPSHPAVSGGYERTYSLEHASLSAGGSSHHYHHHQNHQSAPSVQSNHSRQQHQGSQQRNYKNMTRERRIEANARERTRVHTISAAFDTLRRAIPAYSHNQKLSKLSVLRIACSYIMTLGKIVNTPEGESANGASLGACVDLVSRTIQTEGKLRKRKED